MTVRKLHQITCKKCGDKAMRWGSAMYCDACKPPPHVPTPPKDCHLCGVKLIGYHPNSRHCEDCKRDAVARWRRQKNDNEVSRKVTRYAVKVGFLLHPSNYICMDCKRLQAECYDHRDYSRPLDVDAVCLNCNQKRYKGIPLHLVKPTTNEAA